MSNYEPKVGETAVTRDGRKAHVLAIRTDLPEDNSWSVVGYIEGDVTPICWQRDGRYSSVPEYRADLVGPWVDPGADFMCLYECGDHVRMIYAASRVEAEELMTGVKVPLAIIRSSQHRKVCEFLQRHDRGDSFPVAPDCG